MTLKYIEGLQGSNFLPVSTVHLTNVVNIFEFYFLKYHYINEDIILKVIFFIEKGKLT